MRVLSIVGVEVHFESILWQDVEVDLFLMP